MIVDRYFNPKTNTFVITANIIEHLQNIEIENISEFFNEMNARFPNTYDNYLFEAIGLLFLTDKITIDCENDTIGLKI